jgi:hypothetical protein
MIGAGIPRRSPDRIRRPKEEHHTGYVRDDYDRGQPTAYGIAKEIEGILKTDGFDARLHSNAAEVLASQRGREFRIRVVRTRARRSS